MPGVPSGRGCDACRAQKKKCDQAPPSCSRCTRLRIPCVGSGWQRFKFITDRRSPPSPSRTRQSLSVSRAPSNPTTQLAHALVGKLEAADDLRYHLPWTYGGFLADIPARLGANPALDAAAAALVSAHSSLGSHRGPGSPPVDSLVAYSRALRSLRTTLSSPTQARSAETLCAVMLLLIVQGFLGTSSGGGWTTHGEGAAALLKARGRFDTRDAFEDKLLLALRGPVLFEALVNPKISFTPEEWGSLVENGLDGDEPEGRMLRVLARAPGLMQRGRAALRTQIGLEMLIAETRLLYGVLTGILSGLRSRLETLQELSCGSWSSQFVAAYTKAHSHYQRTYGLGLAVCIIFNCVLKALGAGDAGLAAEAAQLCAAVLTIADEAAVYRPLGASYVTLCLMAAWCGCKDEMTRVAVEGALAEYQTDFPGWMPLGVRLEGTAQRLSLRES